MLNGYELEGRELKVERFKHSKHARAKVPEKLVAYVLGTNKKLPNGAQNNLRRICKDDVERLSRGQPSKRKVSKIIFFSLYDWRVLQFYTYVGIRISRDTTSFKRERALRVRSSCQIWFCHT